MNHDQEGENLGSTAQCASSSARASPSTPPAQPPQAAPTPKVRYRVTGWMGNRYHISDAETVYWERTGRLLDVVQNDVDYGASSERGYGTLLIEFEAGQEDFARLFAIALCGSDFQFEPVAPTLVAAPAPPAPPVATASATATKTKTLHPWLASALAYHERGWAVVPLADDGQRPAVRWQPFQHQRTTVEQVQEWFTSDREYQGLLALLAAR